ncbi:MAG: hypothetical protein HYZ54_09510 [Ignavibacteriae bacterium]|nr:hypothetical protein [Ignavibacteriota bacterium]
MNQAHFHLVLNHLPIVFPIVGLLVLGGGLIVRSEIIKRIAYGIFIMGALSAIPALLTGEGAEDVVEKIQGVSEQYIKTHEEVAEVFAILSFILGTVSLAGLWANWKQKSYSNALSFVTLALSLVVLFYSQRTGTTGGEIRHTEIRTATAVSPSSPENNSTKNNDGDDD